MVNTRFARSNRRAFAMMDAIAAMALLTAGVFMALAFFRTEVREVRMSHERLSALLIAQSEVERLYSLSYDDIPVGEDQSLALDEPAAARLKGSQGLLSVAEIEPGLKRAEVRVTWRSPLDRPLHVDLTCTLSREGLRP